MLRNYKLSGKKAILSVLHPDKAGRRLKLGRRAGNSTSEEVDALLVRFGAMRRSVNNDIERAEEMVEDEQLSAEEKMPQTGHGAKVEDPDWKHPVATLVKEIDAIPQTSVSAEDAGTDEAFASHLASWERVCLEHEKAYIRYRTSQLKEKANFSSTNRVT